MAQADPDPMAVAVAANEKLLKALIALLSLKDEHLLEELTTVFLYASETEGRPGSADEATWRRVRRELALIAALIEETGGPGEARALDS